MTTRKTKLWHEEDDTSYALRKRDIEQQKDILNKLPEWSIIGDKGYKEASSTLSQGRNCPYCAGNLKFFEASEKGYDVVFCNDCHKRFFIDDVNHRTMTTDALYRSIPKDLILYWDTYLRNERKKEREQAGSNE